MKKLRIRLIEEKETIPKELEPLVREALKYKSAEEFKKEGEYGIRRVRIDNWAPEEIELLKKHGYNIYMKDLYTIYAEGIDYLGLDPSVPSTFPPEIYPGKVTEVKRIPSYLHRSKSFNPVFSSVKAFYNWAKKVGKSLNITQDDES